MQKCAGCGKFRQEWMPDYNFVGVNLYTDSPILLCNGCLARYQRQQIGPHTLNLSAEGAD